MKKLVQSTVSALFISCLAIAPALAKGEISVELPNGDFEVYSDVTISNTADIVYFASEESSTILMITKKDCVKEDKLLVCDKARIGVDTDGVIEEIGVKEIFLFINPTNERQPIKGSTVTMSPNTILLEAATTKGTFITGLGRIDNTTKPAGASQ